MNTTQPFRRVVTRIETKTRMGADAQVDDRAVAITPMNPAATDPFLLLSEDWFSSPGFEWHPHRGLETVTLVLDGVLEHGDNLGNAGALTTGDVQWMTAGRGIIHRELAYRDERAHTLQLWVNLPGAMKMVDTRYQDLRAADRPVIERNGVRVDMVSGDLDGVSGPAANHWPISGALVTLEPNRHHEHLLPAADRAFFYVISGEVIVAGRTVKAGQIAWSDPTQAGPASAIGLDTANGDRPSTVMVYSGRPIREPVTMGGPFVMNTKTEIATAFTEFRTGKFGPIPRQARLQYR